MRWRLGEIEQTDEGGSGLPLAPGLHDIEVRIAGGRRGRFTLSLPTSAATAAPLVLVLHYAGTPTRYYGRPLLEELIEPAFRPIEAVYIAPESLDGPWASEANEAFVMQLLDGIGAALSLDRARTVVTGYSMGAIGTWHFITHYPDRFSAAVPIAGFPRRELACTVPVHAFHGARDELFPLALLADRVRAARGRGCPVELTEVDVHGHFDVSGYRAALAAVPPWLRAVWAAAPATR